MQMNRRRLIAATVTLLVLVTLVGAAMLLAQRRIVPRVVELVETRGTDLCSCELSIGRGRYRLFRRLDLEQISLSLPQIGGRATVERARIRFPLRGALTLRRSGEAAFRSGEFDDLWSRISHLADERLIPLRVEIRGFEIAQTMFGDRQPLRVPTALFRHHRDQKVIAFAVGENSGPISRLSVDADYGNGRVSAAVELLPFDLRGLAPSVSTGTVRISGAAVRRRSGEIIGESYVSLRGLTLNLPVVSEQPLAFDALSYEVEATFVPRVPVGPEFATPPPFPSLDFASGVLTVTHGELVVDDFVMQVRPELRGVTGGSVPSAYDAAPVSNRATASLAESPAGRSLTSIPRYLVLDLAIPETDFSRALDAVPGALLGPLDAAVVDGSFWWEANARVPLHSLSWMDLAGAGELSEIRVEQMPASMNVHKLIRSFPHMIVDPATGFRQMIEIPAPQPPPLSWLLRHSERTFRYLVDTRERETQTQTAPPRLVGSAGAGGGARSSASNSPTYRYRRLTQMSDWIISAVLTAEDGDFFFHDGVSFTTLPRAIERNLLAGEIQFGASTITMQLAKMLFLDQERVFSRKLQEVLLVFLIEHYVPVPKSRILELYLNLAEFGPGIFGIDQAARYYFGKDPSALDAGEATWLASILPSPRRYHAYYEAGAITPGWFARMQGLYAVMLERGRMTQEEYDEAMRGPPAFARRSSSTEPDKRQYETPPD